MSTTQDIEVHKSENDIREYKLVNLSNGLQALLVHDPRVATKGRKNIQMERLAAVSMSMCIGNFRDPKNMYGLAHLVEHMYTQDSENISKNDGFERFVSEHGGFTNAETSSEYSSFYFDISGRYLEGALKRFADCLIAPNIEKTALESELEAVDNEFLIKKDNLQWILEHLRLHTLKENHPHHDRFLCGNKKSLMGDKNDCDDLLKSVKDFRSKHYSGENMKLVIIGGEALMMLEQWVVEFFRGLPESGVKKKKRKLSTRPTVLQLALPESPPCLWAAGKKYIVEAPTDDEILEISWSLPSLRQMYQYKPEGYISYLLNQKGEGSLSSLLKHKGLITSLKAGIYHTSRNSIFTISIYLTKSGAKEVKNIISLVYEYLNLLRHSSPKKWLFEEIQKIGKLKFNYEAKKQLQYATRLSVNLLFYLPEDVIFADHKYRWNETLIRQIFSYFTPKNMRIDHVTPKFPWEDDESGEEAEEDEHEEGDFQDDVEGSQEESESNLNYDGDTIVEDDEPVEEAMEGDVHSEEAFQDDVNVEGSQEQSELNFDDVIGRLPWFETRYCIENIDGEFMKKWSENCNIHQSLKFPSSNKFIDFIPKKFSVHVEGTSRDDNSTLPKCVVDEEWVKVWCKQDNLFRVPQAAIYLRIHFYGAWNGPRNCILSELFTTFLCNKLSEVTFKARMVGCKINVEHTDGMLEVKILGFSSLLLRLLSEVLVEIGSFVPTDSDHYNQTKDEFKRCLISDGNPIRDILLREHNYFSEEMIGHLNDTLLLNFKGFIEDIRSKVVFIESLCHGNVKEEDAVQIYHIIKKSFHRYAIPDGSKQVAERVITLPSSANIGLSFSTPSKLDPTSHVEVYFQIEQLKLESLKLLALLDLFDVIVEPLFENEMRTKNKYGYDLSSYQMTIQNVLGYYFEIISSLDPYMLRDQIENFIDNDLEKHLCDLKETTFHNYKTSVEERILQDRSSLKKESQDLWTSITVFRFHFDVYQKEIEILQNLEKKDLIEYYKKYFKSSSPDCRRVKLNIVSNTIKEMKDEGSMEKISEIKKNSSFYE